MIVVEDYQQDWPERFLEEKKLLKAVFAELPMEIYHMGSTSIPSCKAKPTLDILGVTSDITLIDPLNQEMVKIGYKPLGEYGMRQRRFFKKAGAHVHIFEDSDPESSRHLRFCRYLTTHPGLIKEYSQLKKKLAKKFPESMQDYILGKEKWIKKVDILAAQERCEPLFHQVLGPRKEVWKEEEILKALHVNMHLHMTLFSKYVEEVEQVFEPDVTVIRSPLKDDILNYVLAAKFDSKNFKERIKKVTSHYKSYKTPFSWWVSAWEDTPDFLGDELERQGFTLMEENVGMYRRLESEKEEKGDFRRIDSVDKLADFANIILSLGGIEALFEQIYRKIPELFFQEGSPFEIYVLYANGKPVTTGIALFHAQVMGLYYIATKEGMRKQGWGSKMMRYLLRRGWEKGYKMATLQASLLGIGLYEKIGFLSCNSFYEYAYKQGK